MSLNDLLARHDLNLLKPLAQLLLFPPAAPLLLSAAGLALRRWRPRLGLLLAAGGLAVLWLLSAPGVAQRLAEWLTPPPDPLDAEQIAALVDAPHTAVLVLGAGRREYAPEYDGPDLSPLTAERLRFGIRLARHTGLPLGYSGGKSPLVAGSLPEATAAAMVAEEDYGVTLRWREDRSRDTRENARYSVALLKADGITQVVLVTHALHQRRAIAAFEAEIARQHATMRLVPAGVDYGLFGPLGLTEWWPSMYGLTQSYYVLHEWAGRLAGA